MYTLDTNAAKSADQATRITETGKYIGRFIRAQHITANKTGTKGIDFDFILDDARKARFAIYTLKADGTQLYGYRQLMAMMTVLSLRELTEPTPHPAKIWNVESNQEETQPVPQFMALLNKPIGVLLEMEEYEPLNATANKWRPVLAGVFQADTELTASEILDRKTQPHQLAERVARLKSRPIKYGVGPAHAPSPAPTYQTVFAGSSLAEMDNDIPF